MYVKWWDPETPPGINDEEYREQRATALIAETAAIEMRQNAWHEFNLWNSTLFYNRQLPAFRWGSIAAEEELYPADLRTENLIETIGQSMLSKACSQPLIPSPVPHGTSYKVKRSVEKLQKFMAEAWKITEAEDAAAQAFLDAYVSSIGAVQVNFTDGALSVEPVFFDNLIIDNRECTNRTEPRTVRKRMVFPRVAVEAAYPDFYHSSGRTNYNQHREIAEDYTVVVEAFRRPDKKGKGGIWMVVCDGKILAERKWKEQWLPIVFFHWSDRGSGFFARSGVEQCIPYQVAQNEINEAIKKTQDICSRPRLLAHTNSNIDINQWDNEFGRILGYSGTEPKPFIWPTNLGDLYQERERNRSTCFSYFGLSEMSAGADLPQQVRLDSSAGVREFRNLEDSRHLRLWTRFEKFRLEIAHRFLDMLGKEAPDSFKVTYMGDKAVVAEDISLKDIKGLSKNQFSWTLEAVPLSSQSPAARRETLAAWQSQGKIRPDDDISMVGNPDLERIDRQEQATVRDIDRVLQKLTEGEYEAPAEYSNLVYGIPACIANIADLKAMDDVHPEAIALHEQWLLDAYSVQASAAQAMQAMTQPPAPGFDPSQGVQGAIM